MRITVLPGDGIGPEIMDATLRVLDASGAQLSYDIRPAGKLALETEGTLLPEATLQSIAENKIALKGPITTPIGHGFSSVNVALRRHFDLYQNIRPVTLPGPLETKFPGVDLVLFRENTEDLYAGIEEVISEDEVHSIKVITRGASQRILRAAFQWAQREGANRVTVITKANIMKKADGLFLEVAREVQREFPEIELQELLVDHMAMELVLHPERYHILVTENLYGDILSDLAAGLIGGLGLAAGVNRGEEISIYEAVHGSAPDIAGKGLANPTALILSACLMLEHHGQKEAAQKIRRAVYTALSKKENRTPDLGGPATMEEYSRAIIEALAE
ncbi:MAG: isocitrate/isopropylmalate family dehydrogenase [Tissierellia bacterium]|nr:isocitrate/isopropylmalate family dehydrogenase [Tissierellia bacterium]